MKPVPNVVGSTMPATNASKLAATQAKFNTITVHTLARLGSGAREKYQTIAANGNSNTPAVRINGAGMFNSGSTVPARAIMTIPVVPLMTASATSKCRIAIEEAVRDELAVVEHAVPPKHAQRARMPLPIE